MKNTEKLEKVAKDADLITEHKKESKGRGVAVSGLTPIKKMTKAALMLEVGASRKKIPDLEKKLVDFSKSGSPPEDQIPPEMWAVFPSLAYDYMATRFGPHWKLNEEEMLLYGQNIQKVADRYLGAVAGDNPELFSLALVAVSVTVPRVMVTVKQRGENAASGKEANGNSDGPGSKGLGKKLVGPKGAS